MQRIIYVEGETERILLKKILKVIPKVEIFNPWHNRIEKKLRKFETIFEKIEVIILYDADLAQNTSPELFLTNLKTLHQRRVLKGLVQQTNSLEDELIRSCAKLRCNKDLHDLFNVAGQAEFKNALCQISNPAQKLQDAGFDPAKLWRGELIEALEDYRAYHKTADYLLKQRK